MNHIRSTPLEAFVRTETIDEGLKRAHIDYMIPEELRDEVSRTDLAGRIIYLSAAHTLGIYAVQTTHMMAGVAYHHTHEIVRGLPAEVDQFDANVIISNPRDFALHLGYDLTNTLINMLQRNQITSHTVLHFEDH